MSDGWIIIIPEAIDYVPSREARRKVVDLFRCIAPRAEDIKEEATEEVQFFDCGQNFSRTICPVCGAELDMEWWREKMDEDAEEGYPLRPLILPCCGERKSLNQLVYDWPQGFARFSIEAMNPAIADLSDEQVRAFESVLGCRVRKILQHI